VYRARFWGDSSAHSLQNGSKALCRQIKRFAVFQVCLPKQLCGSVDVQGCKSLLYGGIEFDALQVPGTLKRWQRDVIIIH
jgi:hypothetical protein